MNYTGLFIKEVIKGIIAWAIFAAIAIYLRESLEETDDYDEDEDDEETKNTALQEEKKVVKSSNKKNDSIFDDIDLD